MTLTARVSQQLWNKTKATTTGIFSLVVVFYLNPTFLFCYIEMLNTTSAMLKNTSVVDASTIVDISGAAISAGSR